MTHKLIKTDNYLLVVGNNYKSDKFPYTVVEKLTTGEYQLWQVDNPNDWDEPNQYELLAHLPLNGSPILEGVDLLPAYEDDVIELADEWVFHINGHNWSNNDSTAGDNFGSFIAGYNKAREKYKYTEEDVKTAIRRARWILRAQEIEFDVDVDSIIQSLSHYPTDFECEMEPYTVGEMSSFPRRMFGTVDYKPKTITTAQGIQWVGKYL